MKKAVLFLVAAILLPVALQAQKMNAVKTDLFSPIIRTYVIKYERALNEDMGFQLGFFYTMFNPSGTETTFSGYGITPEFRY